MKRFLAFGLTTLVAVAGFAAGCSGEDPPPATTSASTSTSSSAAASTGGGTDSLYDRLGGNAGITGAVDAFVGKVVANPKINSYFLNKSVDAEKLKSCLVKQLGEAVGGPEKYDCGEMKPVHANLHISKADFDDLVGDLVAVLTEAKVAPADIMAIGEKLLPMEADIVTEKNDGNVYQRLGRKPAIITVIDAFVAKVVANAEINGFFGAANADRLKTCLVRQVSQATGGPAKYGEEVDAGDLEKGVAAANPCKAMAALHAGLKDDKGSVITKTDFDALVADLVAVLTDANVAPADIATIGGALGPLCKDIVADATTCPAAP